MFTTVIQFSADTNGICSTRAGYITSLNSLQVIVKQINNAIGTQSTVTTGTTKDRKTLYDDLIIQYTTVTNGAAGYADSINNNTLFDNFSKSDSQIAAIGFDSINAKTEQLIIDVNPYLIPLGTDWGINTTVMSNLSTALSDYNDSYSLPREAIVNKDTQTQTILPPLFTSGRKVLKRSMDKAAKTLKATNAEWFSKYTFSRELITIHHEITTVKVLITDSVTTKAIPYAKVSSPEEHLSKTSDLNGSAIIQPFIPGDSTLLVEAAGYHSKTIPAFHIKPGETQHFNISLDPII